jgi:hypothetical protein
MALRFAEGAPEHPQQKGLFTFVSEIFISETLQDPHVK